MPTSRSVPKKKPATTTKKPAPAAKKPATPAKNYGLSSSAAATKREIAGTLAEAQGTREARTIDGRKEVELRGQGNLERFGMKTYEFTPGGSSIAGTSVPIRTGQELFDLFL